MSWGENLFSGLRVDSSKLLPYGFVPVENGYRYSVKIMDNQFIFSIHITADGKIFLNAVDADTGDDYALLNIENISGAFVGKIRKECEIILQAVANQCFVKTQSQTEQIIAYLKHKYGDEPEYLWAKTPENGIFRRQDNGKWYAALLNISELKLGLPNDKKVDILDLKASPEQLEKLLDNEKYFPGYHMNKKHWLTIRLNDSLPFEEICLRLDESRNLALKG